MKNKEKWVLCVGSSFSAVPIYFILKKYGFKVAVCGNEKNDPCHQYADKSFFIDYSDKDELLKLVQEEKFEYIVPTCNDSAYVSSAKVAYIAGYPGFDNPENVSILHTKNEFRAFTEKFNIDAPKSVRLNFKFPQDNIGLDYPLIVKPVNVSGGRGVSKVDNEKDLTSSLETAASFSDTDTIVIEEFKEGTLHSHSAFVKDGKLFTDFFVDEFCTVYPWQVNCSNYPSNISESTRNLVRKNIEKLVETLEIVDGLLHTQFILDKNGEDVWLVECMRRAPGDLYGKLIERATGFDYFDAYVRPFIGKELNQPYLKKKEKFYGRHTISVSKPVVYFSFVNNLPAKNLEIVMLKNSGMMLGVAPFDKLAIVFSEFDEGSSLFQTTPHMDKFITINTME